MICRLILFLSHVIGNILITLRYRYKIFKDVISRRLGGEKKIKSLQKIRKLPCHIGIVVLEEEISYKELSKIIIWCLSLGVPYISIYDPDGQIKSHKEKLYAQTQQLKDEVFQKVSSNYKVTFSSSENMTHKERNGYSKETNCTKIMVNLLCRKNGRSDIAAAIRRHAICWKKESVLSEQRKPDLSYYLQGNANFPDPDLLLQFGPVHTTMGYLPWHIRLTELHSFHTHHGIELSDFLNMLKTYSNSEQRFGK